MSYPGNPSLSTAVKDRVVSTFQQTLALYKQGRTDEVVQGCSLLLQMDPSFDPAKKLLEKARNPMSPIDVDSLLPKTADDAMQQAREAMAARDFQRVIHLTTEILTNDLMNDEARVLGDEARDKLEAAPFVDQFVKKCDQALAAGNAAAARADLEKARQLDATHPQVIRISRQLASPTPAAAPPPAPPAQSSSFIVETPSAVPGRGTAQAADFGFTFEEDAKPAAPAQGFSFDSPSTPAAPASGGGFSGFSFDSPAQPAAPAGDGLSGFSFGTPAATPSSDSPFAGGFSFDSPAAPAAPAAPSFNFDAPPAAAPGEFDFSTASMDMSPDDQKKIEQYLADGDRAFNAGEYQQAIDFWSRIFLIDVTHEQASERIERAKAKRRELEQKIEPILTAAVQAFDRNDFENARTRFAEVLRADPNNLTAQDYMDRLTESVAEGGAAAVETPYIPPTPTKMDIFADDPMSGDAPLMPPEPEEEDLDVEAPPPPTKGKAAAAAKAKAPVKAKKSTPMGLIAAIVAAVVLLGGGYFAWTRMNTTPETDPAATQGIFTRANKLANQGKYDQAISILQDIKPDDPQHDKALELIADFTQKKASASQTIDGRPAAVFFQEKLTEARAAFDAHDYVGAKRAWDQAQRARALPPDIKASYDEASQQVAKLAAAKQLFAERKYQEALTALQTLHAADPANQNVKRMVVDAHFNLGTMALQDDRIPDAMREFDEVLKIDPNDELARRSRQLADRYNNQPKDLLYRIYVKYLPLRRPA